MHKRNLNVFTVGKFCSKAFKYIGLNFKQNEKDNINKLKRINIDKVKFGKNVELT